MNKSQLVDQVAEATKLPRTQIEETLNSTFEVIKKAIQEGNDVTLVGFGTFTRSLRKARTGWNPQTETRIQIPEMTLPRFKPGKEFRELLQ